MEDGATCLCDTLSCMVGASLWLVLGTALLIAVADSLIKKSGMSGDFFSALMNPLMVGAFVLYAIQVLLTLYIFLNKGELAIYANLFVAFYSILTVLIGVLVFKEHISVLQGFGIALALAGVFLINSH